MQQGKKMNGATSAGVAVDMDEHRKGHSPDLDAARGLLPAIVVGAAVWAIIFAIAALLWGCTAPAAH
jgi:hypothetical protein